MVSFYCSHMRNKVANNMWTNYMLTELANIAGNSARTGTEMKMDASFVLFKAPRRVTFREEDMTVEKMAKIFQVTSQSLYLTGDNNVAVFPRVDGHFSSLNLRDKAHYEVHGAKAAPDASGNVAALGPPPTPSSNSQFRFSRSASSASPSLPPRAQSLKYFTRRRDDNGRLDSVFEKIEEVVLTAQGLSEVTAAIQGLSDVVHRNRKTTVSMVTCAQ
ncbi:uncharacterized protein LOC126397583 isoform X2 [Epinephelus moara]|uniref:uncharacterized protein LOC126397583 isoform X2 n=1 Tax=Epinephelus moara TaxID=300413 RepID=UPI00214F46EA|nr:uncharacterized protein LOC126397583 isoform X2 [Epinephelus moara]